MSKTFTEEEELLIQTVEMRLVWDPHKLISPENAPRTADDLCKVGIFQLRLLFEKLGGLKDNLERQAFAIMSVDQKVELVLEYLRKWDVEHS